jgi:hypothetical protein
MSIDNIHLTFKKMARFNSVAIHLWSLIWLISYVIADLENTHHVRKSFFIIP